MPISEKTVELNVISELSYWAIESGYRPLIIGFTQRQEAIHGIDSAFRSSQAMLLQFKRGYRRSDFYSYSINSNSPRYDQHKNFLEHTDTFGYYALPLFHSLSDVIISRGSLIMDTEFVPVREIGDLTPEDKRHRIRIYDNDDIEVRSEPKIIGKRKPFLSQEDLERITNGENPKFLFDRLKLPPIKRYIVKHDNNEIKNELGIEVITKKMKGYDQKTYFLILQEDEQ